MSDLPQGWAISNLGATCELYQPQTISKSEMTPDGPYPVFGANGIIGRYHQFNHEESQLLMTCRGATCGTINISEPKSWITGNSMVIRPRSSEIDRRFLERYLRGGAGISDVITGSAQPQITRASLEPLEVPLAPLPEQRRIVAKVDGLTARTARARKELDRLPTLFARYKQRLLALAFSGAKAERWPNKLIGDVSSFVTSGSRGWAQYYSDNGDLFVRVGNVKRSDINLDLVDVQFVSPPSGAEGRRTELQIGDVLVTITADLGRVGVYESEKTAYVNQHVALVRLNDPAQARYVAWYLSSEAGQSQLFENNRGVTKAGLGLGDIKGVSVPTPSKKEQAEIVRRIESAFGWLDRVAADHAAAARLLPKLDAAILAKAFRGELVPQNPEDEPAEMLLDRMRTGRATAPRAKRGRRAA